MHAISLEIPKEIAAHLKLPAKQVRKLLMKELTLRLCDQGIITSGQGAALLKMERLIFERLLAENEIPIHGDPDELAGDLANIERVL